MKSGASRRYRTDPKRPCSRPARSQGQERIRKAGQMQNSNAVVAIQQDGRQDRHRSGFRTQCRSIQRTERSGALNSLARQPRAAFPVTPSAVASLRRPARLASGVAAGPESGLLRKELRASRWPTPSNPRSGHMPSETVDAWTKTADWIHLRCSKYLEIPGLHLTRNQVQRLWGLDTVRCDAILDALVDAGFLRRTHRGAYVRADGGGR
jgi:hypothetical protein